MKHNTPHFRKNQGLSLVETMISMVLGLFLVGGLSIIYLNTKDNDKIRQAVTEMEANARMAMEYLNQGIQHAGYRSIYIIPFDKPFLSAKDGAPPNTICRNGGTNNNLLLSGLTPAFSKDGSDSTSDQITSVFMPDNPDDAINVISRRRIFTDCAGSLITEACSADPENGMPDPMTSKMYNSFYIDAENQLVCVGSRTAGIVPIEIAENIENMQIRYGVASEDQIRYKTADEVEAEKGSWRKVKSIQVALLIRSSRDVLKKDETRSFELLDQTITIDATHKKKLHRVYSTTIHLGNRT